MYASRRCVPDITHVDLNLGLRQHLIVFGNPNRFGLRLPVYSGLRMFTLLLLAGDIQSNTQVRGDVNTRAAFVLILLRNKIVQFVVTIVTSGYTIL